MSEVVAGIVEADTLQSYLDTLLSLVDECKIHFGDHGLRVSAVEPANVAMYQDVTLAPRAFEHFETPGQAVVGVPLTRLDERLGRADGGDLVEFALDMQTRKLSLEYRNIEQSVALIDPDSIRSEPDNPDLDLPNTLTIEGRRFEDAVAVAEMTSDHLAIQGRPDDRQVCVVAENDVDDSVVTFDDETSIDADVTRECESLFSTEYLDSIAGPMPADAEVTITFGDEFPVVIEYETLEGALSVEAMVAPRISS